jgi:hypothetical protein
MKYQLLWSIIVLMNWAYTSQCQTSKQPYDVRLEATKSQIKNWDDLKVQATVTSLTDSGIIVPKVLWTSSIDYPVGDFCYEVEFKTDTGYQKVKFTTNVDHFGTQDVLRRLGKRENIVNNDNLCSYYTFDRKGHYRARVVYHASKFNDVEDVYSNWIVFEIKNDKLYLTRKGSFELE